MSDLANKIRNAQILAGEEAVVASLREKGLVPNDEPEIPRRIRMDLMKPAELAIQNAIWEVEKVGADVKLTEAVILLSKAKDLVSDFIDTSESEVSANG